MNIKDFFEQLLGCLGCLGVIILFLLVPLFFSIRCERNRDIEKNKLREKLQAYKDSIALVQQQRQAEIESNRAIFYKYFSKHYDFFEDESDFSDWLDELAHEDGMELLHYMYSKFYSKYRGEDGYYYMIEDLGWEDSLEEEYDPYY